ncbi:MAG: hypothetical protein IJ158_06245 [Treponema sp.]|nr:hypothetical protein [Treponema sp.]
MYTVLLIACVCAVVMLVLFSLFKFFQSRWSARSITLFRHRPSKYIGSDKNISNTIVSEIRRNKFTNGTKVESTISNSKEDIQRASEFAKKYETEFQRSTWN